MSDMRIHPIVLHADLLAEEDDSRAAADAVRGRAAGGVSRGAGGYRQCPHRGAAGAGFAPDLLPCAALVRLRPPLARGIGMGLRAFGRASGACACGAGRAGVSPARSPPPLGPTSSALHQLITRAVRVPARPMPSSASFQAFRRPREASALLPPRASESHHARMANRCSRRARHLRAGVVAG